MTVSNSFQFSWPRQITLSVAFAPVLTVASLAYAAPAVGEIRFANGNDYLPFTDENALEGGMATEIVSAAAELLGEPLTFFWLDWTEGFEETKAGKFDGTLPYFYNRDRDADFFYSDTIYDDVQRIFVGSGVKVPTSIDEISGMTICNPVGYAAPDSFRAEFEAGRAKEESPPDMTRCFELLSLGRVDAVLAPSLQGRGMIEQIDGLDAFSVTEAPWNIQINTQSIIASEALGAASCHMIARLNGAMAILRRDGTYDEIVRKHLGEKGDLARLDEAYKIELQDGTTLRGQPRSFQRGVFIIDTLEGGQELVPEQLLVLFRREGYDRFNEDDEHCRNAPTLDLAAVEPDEKIVDTTVPLAPELTLKGSASLADSLIPALITAYSNSDGKLRDISESANSTGEQLYTVATPERDKPKLFSVAAMDPTLGFVELARGKADLVLADRRATDTEVSLTNDFNGRGISDAERVLALEAFAVIVNPTNPISYIQGGLKAEDVRLIASGSVTDWSQLGLNLGPINFAAANGAAEILTVTGPVFDTDTLIAKVASDPTAVALVPLGAVDGRTDVRLTDISVCDAQHPASPFAVKTEEYPFVRRLMAYLPSTLNPHAGPFIAFAESSEGQVAISDAGAISLGLSAQSPEETAKTLAGIARRISSVQDASSVGKYTELASNGARISTTFRFEPGSDRLDARAIEDARRLARYLRETPEANGKLVLLVGFTDSKGSARANNRLAERRAASVQRQLALEGFPSANVLPVGEDLPVACNTESDGRALNRRVEVWLR